MRNISSEKNGIFLVRKKDIPSGSIAHIIQRAPGRELLFLEKGDYLYFLKILKEIAAKFKMEIFCFVLMNNHFHLLVRFLEENASQAVKNLCEKYAWFFNSKYKRKGHVFYGRYRASLCLGDSYLLAVSLYIHRNPVNAGIVSESMLYKWSSIALYIQDISSKTFIKYRFILDIVNDDIVEARKIYSELLAESEKLKTDGGIDDVGELKKLHIGIYPSFSKVKRIVAKDKNVLLNWSIEEAVNSYSKLKRTRSAESREAKKYLIQQLVSRGYSIEDVAGVLNITKRSVYKIIA